MAAGLAIRLYEITVEGTDAAGNIGRDLCRVIIVPSNMTIQEADAIIQKSFVRYPVATTTDLGIMLETKTNIILGYIQDSSQALFNEIKATHSSTSRARERGLMEADEGRSSSMLHENTPTNVVNQTVQIEVELWMLAATVVGCVCAVGIAGVGFGFVLGRIDRAG
jgi:hypothetical protein